MLQNQASIPTRKQGTSLLEKTMGTFLDTTEEIKGSQRRKGI